MSTDHSNQSSDCQSDDKADSKSSLEQLFSHYPIQTSIMQNLNWCDFRNIQLAGCRVPETSRAARKKYLIPIHCNELRYSYDSVWECENPPEDVLEMKRCQGLALRPDDPELGPWEPCFEHNGTVEHNDFWVCTHCRHESQESYRGDYFQLHQSLHTPLCETHSLEQYAKLPHNACSCWNTAMGNWRCDACIRNSLELLRLRSEASNEKVPMTLTLFGMWTFIVFPYLEWLMRWLIKAQHLLEKYMPWRLAKRVGLRPGHLNMVRRRRLCPMENCVREGWFHAPGHERMQMCMGCKAIFPG